MSNAGVQSWTLTAADNTAINGINIAENCAAANINNAIRQAMSSVMQEIAYQGADVSASASMSLAGVDYRFMQITGSASIIHAGTGRAGLVRWARWNSNSVISNNANLITDGGADLTVATDDVSMFLSFGSGVNRVIHWPKSGYSQSIGKHLVPIPSVAMNAAATAGAAAGVFETTTNKVNFISWDFDSTSTEYVYFTLPMPSSWNESTVSFRTLGCTASTTGVAVMVLQGVSISSGDSMDAAYGTGQSSTVTLTAALTLQRGNESSAITIAGTPAASDQVSFRLYRDAKNASDTLEADARITGIELFLTTNAGTDS
jgi:hypothetical protein